MPDKSAHAYAQAFTLSILGIFLEISYVSGPTNEIANANSLPISLETAFSRFICKNSDFPNTSKENECFSLKTELDFRPLSVEN